MADRDDAKLKGPVSMMRFRRDRSGYVGELAYDRQGNLLENRWTNADRSTGRSVNFYASTGRLERRTSYQSGKLVSESRMRYDDQDRLVLVEESRVGGEFLEVERFSYDAEGRKTWSREIPANFSLGAEDFLGAISISMSEAGTATVQYDLDGNPTQLLLHNREHELASRLLYTFDAQNRLISQKHLHGTTSPLDQIAREGDLTPAALRALEGLLGEGGVATEIVFHYDARGRLVERSSKRSTTRYEFADHDEPVRETTERRSGGFRIVGGVVTPTASSSRTRVVDYDYAFDDQGNWTRRTISGEGFSDTEHREFEYFDE